MTNPLKTRHHETEISENGPTATKIQQGRLLACSPLCSVARLFFERVFDAGFI